MKDKQSRRFSQGKSILRRFLKNRMAVIGLIVFTILICIMLFSNWIVPIEKCYEQNLTNKLKPPSATHIMGTDEMGRDVFARIVHGSKRSISIGIIVTLIAASLGIVLGAISGYFGGKIDMIIMRLSDVLMSIPYILFCITVITALGLGMGSLIVAMCIAITPSYARIVRASVLSLKGVEYIEAATATGCKAPRIIFRHIIPNVIGPIIVKGTVGTASVILGAASLSFIGLGFQPPSPEWGTMMSTARTYMRVAPHLIVIPGLFIMITTLSLNLMGDGLRDALDPRLRN